MSRITRLLPRKRSTKLLLIFAVLGLGAIGGYTTLRASAAAPQTANLWINNTVSGSCTRSATLVSYAQAASAGSTCSGFQAAVNKTVNGSADTIIVKSGGNPYSASLSSVTRSPSVTIYEEEGGQSTLSGGNFVGVTGVTIDGTTGANKQGFVEAGSGGGYNFSGNQLAAVTNFALKGVRTRGELFFENCNNILIDHVEVYNKTDGEDSIQLSTWYDGPGQYSHACTNVTFDHTYVHDITCSGTQADHLDFIQVLAGQNITVRNSKWLGMTCHTTCALGVDGCELSGSQGWFISCGFQPAGLACSGMTLENSVIGGLDSLGGGEPVGLYTASNVRIVNNTLDGNIKTDGSSVPSPDYPSTVTFKNNISNSPCGSSSGGGLAVIHDFKATNGWANNVFTSNCGYSSEGDTVTSNFNANFVNPTNATIANRDYHLKAGAFAIDKGTNTGCPATDADDNARPAGTSCDAGAYEYGATSGGGGTTYDSADLSNLLSHYGMTSGATSNDGDLNGDGAVNIYDLGILLSNYTG